MMIIFSDWSSSLVVHTENVVNKFLGQLIDTFLCANLFLLSAWQIGSNPQRWLPSRLLQQVALPATILIILPATYSSLWFAIIVLLLDSGTISIFGPFHIQKGKFVRIGTALLRVELLSISWGYDGLVETAWVCVLDGFCGLTFTHRNERRISQSFFLVFIRVMASQKGRLVILNGFKWWVVISHTRKTTLSLPGFVVILVESFHIVSFIIVTLLALLIDNQCFQKVFEFVRKFNLCHLWKRLLWTVLLLVFIWNFAKLLWRLLCWVKFFICGIYRFLLFWRI